MTTEEFQKQVLEKLTNLEQGQKTLEQRQMALESGQKSLEQGQKLLAAKEDIAKIEKGIADLISMSDVTQKEVRAIRSDLRTIEAVTAKNWNDILELKQAK